MFKDAVTQTEDFVSTAENALLEELAKSCELRPHIIQLLKTLGYSNWLTISEIETDTLKQIETFVRTKLAKRWIHAPVAQRKVHFGDIFCSMPEEFEFMPGELAQLKHTIEYAKKRVAGYEPLPKKPRHQASVKESTVLETPISPLSSMQRALQGAEASEASFLTSLASPAKSEPFFQSVPICTLTEKVEGWVEAQDIEINFVPEEFEFPGEEDILVKKTVLIKCLRCGVNLSCLRTSNGRYWNIGSVSRHLLQKHRKQTDEPKGKPIKSKYR